MECHVTVVKRVALTLAAGYVRAGPHYPLVIANTFVVAGPAGLALGTNLSERR